MKNIRIQRVEALSDYRLLITWQNGKQHSIDLRHYLPKFKLLQAVQTSDVFAQVQVGEWGFDVTWGDDAEIAASTLYRLALEQAGEVMPSADFKVWMSRHGLSLTTAAQALGLSRRTVTAYSSGTALIPKHIMLACAGWTYLHNAA